MGDSYCLHHLRVCLLRSTWLSTSWYWRLRQMGAAEEGGQTNCQGGGTGKMAAADSEGQESIYL